jgi:hypothetical protein
VVTLLKVWEEYFASIFGINVLAVMGKLRGAVITKMSAAEFSSV